MKSIDQKVLAALRAHFCKQAYAPTIREIADALHINSTDYIHDSLHRLKEAGCVTWVPKKFRTLALTDAGRAIGGVKQNPADSPTGWTE